MVRGEVKGSELLDGGMEKDLFTRKYRAFAAERLFIICRLVLYGLFMDYI